MILRYAVFWLGLVVIGILNGTLRQFGYQGLLGELGAHQLSSVVFILVIGVYTYALSVRWPIESPAQALTVGGVWLALTVAFEFLFGHYVVNHPWSCGLHR